MPPETPNGVITQYSVQYDGSTIGNFGKSMLNGMMGTVEGLSPDTEYELRLKAYTRVGPGPHASLIVKTSKLWSTTMAYFLVLNNLIFYCYKEPQYSKLGHFKNTYY